MKQKKTQNRLKSLYCAASVLLLLCSCAHTEDTSNMDELPGSSAAKLDPFRETAEKLAGSVLEGIKKKDYKEFSKNMTYEMKSTITQDKFKILLKRFENELGDYESRQYLGTLKQGPLKVALWKAKFSKTNNELLLRLVIGELDGKPKVFGFWLQ